MPKDWSGAKVYYHATNRSEQRLADAINQGIGQTTGHPGHVLSDTTRFRTGFGVLRGAFMPAVLVECGFMESPRDLVRLRDSQGQEQIAEGIALGLTEFHGHSGSPIAAPGVQRPPHRDDPIKAKMAFVKAVHEYNLSLVRLYYTFA